MKKLTVSAVLAVLAVLVCVTLVERGYAQADFYKGKTITVVQIVAAGGTGDMRRRALFPYLQKYIPGNPTILSEYMPGGGGRKAANHVYRVARPDGLTIGGMSSSLVTNAILDTGGVQYDIDKLIYLGSPVSVFHYAFLTRKEAGLSNLEKLRAATGVRIGAQEVGHDVYIVGRLFAYLLDLKKPRFVTGYGGPEIDVALARGELDGRANALETLEQRNVEEMKKGLLDLHAVVEIPRGNRPQGYAQLPEIESFAKSDSERKMLAMYRAFRQVGTPYVFAPGTPKPLVQILQDAIRKTLNDPDFHRDFKKLSGFDASPLMPEEQEKVIRELPRDRTVVELFKKLSGADSLPPR
ncbi:MAG: tripartite tricarboxylate transporter family receptor [Deltaproteobacteria bacterium]|nr:tripartite tricarboxylate transporter family receptor [Deltaproteobacteria bacterium]